MREPGPLRVNKVETSYWSYRLLSVMSSELRSSSAVAAASDENCSSRLTERAQRVERREGTRRSPRDHRPSASKEPATASPGGTVRTEGAAPGRSRFGSFV